MPKPLKGLIASLTFLLLAPTLANAAEIYKWVDEQGNVHFGDKPKDPAQASKAESVEVNEAYRPETLSDEEVETRRREQAAQLDYNAERRREEKQQAEQTRAEQEKQHQEKCAWYAKKISDLTEVYLVNGRPTITVIVDENGKEMTSREQAALADKLRSEAAAAGCKPSAS